MARLDAAYRPYADGTAPAPGPRVAAEAEALLREVIAAYARADGPGRAAIRALFDRYTAFRWAAHLPRDWAGAGELRDRLLHLSACNQGADTRDEILALRDLCARARAAGIDPAPILREVAELSSDEDRYGMGSMRDILLRYGGAA
jgi:hypothetical protein